MCESSHVELTKAEQELEKDGRIHVLADLAVSVKILQSSTLIVASNVIRAGLFAIVYHMKDIRLFID